MKKVLSMNIILQFFTNFLSCDTISRIFARLISRLLSIASKKGGKYWDISKKIIKKTRIWLDLFDQVYEDDEMTQEEEMLVSKAIRNEIELTNVSEIIDNFKKSGK